jgi:hypothetical protein
MNTIRAVTLHGEFLRSGLACAIHRISSFVSFRRDVWILSWILELSQSLIV